MMMTKMQGIALSLSCLCLTLVRGSTTPGPAVPAGPPAQGNIYLTGGNSPGTGNVVVKYDGRWGSICDDGWDLNAAHVACRQLGYPGALGHTTNSYFGRPEQDIILDNVQCFGDERSLPRCLHSPWGVHDCDRREAAGVYCTAMTPAPPSTTSTTLPPTTTTTAVPTTPRTLPPRSRGNGNELQREQEVIDEGTGKGVHIKPHLPEPYEVRLMGGRSNKEGRVEVKLPGHGHWGVICSDNWSLLEATVVCKQLALGHASNALKADFFGGSRKDKLAAGVTCDGDEGVLTECTHEQSGADTVCQSAELVAGVMCAMELPDLVPNATLLERTSYLQDREMYYLQCAMEENCASSSAYHIKRTNFDWHVHRRRLLRFSSSTWNLGTADFRPFSRKQDWDWHQCHMHFHSMEVFALYDLLDLHGNRIAEGHKASFCLEDVQCMQGVEKKYVCKGFGDQGISVGCADDYLHDIDCQWIDISDVKPGDYIFKVHINPEYKVAELNYNNNAATCKMNYDGVYVRVYDCEIGRG